MSDVAISPKKLKCRISSEVQHKRDATIVDLPKEAFVEILSRLPVKSILSCRCVCKRWCDLLSSSNSAFASLHFTRSTPQFFVETFDGNKFSHFMEIEDDANLQNGITIFPSRFEPDMLSWNVVNSCNGFICLSSHYFVPVMVCNPITGEYIDIPSNYALSRRAYIVSGFGCSVTSNQYKVVRLISEVEKNDIELGIEFSSSVEVFTIGTKSWREIGTVSYSLDQSSCVTYFKGAIHWICNDVMSPNYIISFDLENEKFSTISLPQNLGMRSIVV
ncbi:F-box protein At3g07870-like [Rutidosis leptorrhynchoides]|uniref:F-box protein At3g07870-like n=1 Tax=Rutidosis leptorrhynchoides TaxID=125765 RepID=UPI003A9A6032